METPLEIREAPCWLKPYGAVRAESYVLSAALLGRPPTAELLDVLERLDWSEDLPETLQQALEALRQAGSRYPPAALAEEYDRLFVGLGRGEMMPYASWYKEKRIQAGPLVTLRSDLIRLGLVRQKTCPEPEDQAAALCEVMALISRTRDVPLTRQAHFFRDHLAWWLPQFFEDLRSAQRADFYRVVGLFGRRFFETEGRYLELCAPVPDGDQGGEG
jgi:TorA maturation chaperone TorD